MSRAIQTVALRVGASVAALVLVNVALTPVHAEVPGASASATQRAIDNHTNDCAQRTVDCSTPTPTLTVTPTPTGTPTLTPTATEIPTNEPTATPTDMPCWLTDPDVGDPDNAFVVFDDQGAPVPCPPEVAEEPTLEPTATPTPVPSATAVPPTPVPASVASLPRPSNTIQAQPTYTPYPTYTPAPTYTAVASMTPSLTPTLTPTVTPSATSTSVPAHIALVNPDGTDHRKVQPIVQQPDRTAIVLAVLGVLLLVGVLTAIAWRWRRAAYLKALAQLP